MRLLLIVLGIIYSLPGGLLYASNFHSCDDLAEPQAGENYFSSSEQIYRYTASSYELVRITSVGLTEVDTRVSYSFECPIHNEDSDLELFINDDIVEGIKQSAAQVELQPGQTIYIIWEAMNSNYGFSWSFEALPPEPGQLCTNPKQTIEGENHFDQDYWGQWFLYNTTKAGIYKVSTEAFENENTRLIVYLNGCPTSITSSGAGGGQVIDSNYSFELPGGQSLFFLWLSYDSQEFDWRFKFIPCEKRYIDSDGDGYGNPNIFIESCTEVEGYVTNSGDCNDSDSSISPELVWYEDSDSDGRGNPDSSIEGCLKPLNYVANADDCNDEDATLGLEKEWYKDSDEDGFGDPQMITISCEQPDGYVSNSDDCNDDNGNINPDKIWFEDKDGDGFGSKLITRSCEQPEGYVSNSIDCDDSDPELNIERIWYSDADKDGYGNSNFSLRSCSPIIGFVVTGGDCDDNDPDVYPTAPALADGKDNDCDGQVDKLSQEIEFEFASEIVDDGSVINLNGMSSSGLPVSYKVEGPIRLASKSSITADGAGLASITALQEGNDGFMAANPVTVSLCVIPNPEILFQQDNDNKISLNSNYNEGNQWYKNGELLEGENDQTLHISEQGSYSLSVEIDDCSGKSEAYDIFLTGIEENIGQVSIFPNPARNTLNLKIGNSILFDKIVVSVFDVKGQLKQESIFSGSENGRISLNIRDLGKGVYFLNIESQGLFIKEKFVKE